MIAAVAGAAVALALAAGPPSPRMVCGCPSARILAHGPQVLDDKSAVSAWLHDDARIELFQQDAVDKQKLTAVAGAPLAVDGLGNASSSPFVRVRATGPVPERAWLGILRRTDKTPREAVAVMGSGASSAPPPGAPPVLTALWLAPLEQRERPGCGAWLTHRIAFESAPGSPAPEAFLVEDAHTGQKAVVDARYAGVFGLGRIDVCDQGLAFAAGSPTHITVRPVSAAFGVGEPWKLDSDGTGTTDLVRTLSPASADKSRIEDPFPVPGADDGAPSLKTAALLVMGTVVGGAALVALFAFIVIPARRRKLKDIRCPSCGKNVPYDALDPKTDGFFCPSCGAAGFWKGNAAGDAKAQKL